MTSKNRKYKYLVGDPSRVSLSCYAQDDREDVILNISKEPHLCHSKHSKTSHLCHSERSEESHFCHSEHSEESRFCHSKHSEESHFCHPEHSETPYLCHSERSEESRFCHPEHSEESRFCHPEHSEESHFCHSEHSETPHLCHSERSEESRFKKHNLKIIKKISTLLLIISLLLTPTLSIADSPYNVDYFLNIKNIIEYNSFYEPTEEELLQGAIKGLFQSLDPNSQYYTQEEFQTLWEDISGDFVGIGVYIKEEKDSIIITEPIKGSPAYKAGIKPGDKLISVDGKNVEGKSLEEVTSLIKGEPGTSVRIGVNRQEKNIQVNIKRAEIKINPVEYKILKDKIGYIKISQFNPNTYENLVSALKKLDKENISSIIIDLRDNPGGLLGEVVETLKLFIPEGPLVHIKYGKDLEQTYYSRLRKPKYKLTVLVNQNSASASEIFAGAVQDTKVGTIVGVPTYGKGTVQQIIPLPLGDGMKLTIAEYLTPKRKSINQKGIQPDIIVKNNNNTKDIQLEKAISTLKQ